MFLDSDCPAVLIPLEITIAILDEHMFQASWNVRVGAADLNKKT
jgi:hypothetical protein